MSQKQANTKAIVDATKLINDLNQVFVKGDADVLAYSQTLAAANSAIKQATTSQNAVNAAIQNGVKGVQNLITAFNAFQTAFVAYEDLAYGNINQLVALYNAQIDVISAQNNYTQALALQATAVAIYGSNSEYATRATTAANYVSALYTQSKMNETVAQEQYYTATAQNLATIASSFITMAQALGIFQIAQAAMTAAALSDSTALELAALVPFAGAAIAVGATAYELSNQPSPTTLSSPNNSGGGGSSSNKAEIHIHATSNVDIARVRQEVSSELAKHLAQASKKRGVYS